MDPVFFIKSTKIGVFYRYGYTDITTFRDPCFGDRSAQPVPILATPGCALLPCRTISQGHGVARRGAHADRQRPGALGHDGGGESLPWTSSMPGTHLPQLKCQHTSSPDCITNALYDVVLPPSLLFPFTNGVFLQMCTLQLN